MKEAELRKHARCDLCNRLIGETGVPLFWRVRVERFGIDLNAVRRQTGLAMQIGSPFIAAIMGPDQDMAVPLIEPRTATVCEPCMLNRLPHLATVALEERRNPKEADR